MVVQLQLLGGFAARDATEQPLAFATLKSKALLAYLVLNGDQELHRDKLSALLWGSFPEDRAHASLRQALLRVRRAWPDSQPCCLNSNGNTISVDRSTLALDVEAFERLATEGTPDALERAAGLYRGDLLDGFLIDEAEFDDWLRTERSRLQELALGVFQRLLDHYANIGAIERGIIIGNRLLSIDPFQETVQRTLIRFYLYQERRGAALAQYRRCCDLLRQELGVEPEPETQALYRQISKGDSETVAPAGTGGLGSLELPERPTWSGRISSSTSIAVLPFENRDDDPDHRYLCDGLADDVIAGLTRFRELYVIARNSSFSYRDSRVAQWQIGRQLGVKYLLEGSLHRRGKRFRLTTQLVEAKSGQQIWAEQFDTTAADLYAVQDEVIQRIVVTLVDRIAAERLLQARRKPPGSWKAYDHWLQGMAHLRRVDTDSLALAREAFQNAAKSDPAYARAYAGIALTYHQSWSCFNWQAVAYLNKQAYDYAHKAVALDENDHHGHCILGHSYLFNRDYTHAQFHIDRAITLNPNDAYTLANASLVWSFLGEASKAVTTAETAVRLDPHHPDWYSALLGLAYFVGRDYGAAISAMVYEPDAMCDTRAYLAAAYALDDKLREAQRHSEEFLRYCSERFGGNPASDMERYMAWLVATNVYRREEDARHFIEGLRKAGLPA